MGDQQMTQGNRAILDHEAEDRDLQLFVAHGTELEYVGCFRDHDHYEADAPEIGTEEIRKVIVFRLEQLDGTDAGPKRTRPDRLGIEKVKEIPVEQQITETTLIEGSRDPHEVERREQKLVQRVAEHLEDAGHDVCRLQPSVKLEPSAEPALA